MKQILFKILRFGLPILIIGGLTNKYYKWTFSTEGFDEMFLEFEQIAVGVVLLITLVIDYKGFKKSSRLSNVLPSIISLTLVCLVFYFHFSKVDEANYSQWLRTDGKSSMVLTEWITLFSENKVLYEKSERGYFGKEEWYWGDWKYENGVYKCKMSWQTPKNIKDLSIKVIEGKKLLVLNSKIHENDTFRFNFNKPE